MKLHDRWLVVRRAVLTALNTKLEVLTIKYMNKDGEILTRYIHSGHDLACQMHLEEMCNAFTKHAKSAESLENTIKYFALEVQNRWNKNHPNNLVKIVDKADPSVDNKVEEETCL